MIKEETIKRFKDTVKKLIKNTDYNPYGSLFDILVLDTRKREDRIEYCGYETMVKSHFAGSLPFLGSPIKVIVRVPRKNREVLAGVHVIEPLEEEEGVYPYRGDVFLMYSNNAFFNKSKDTNPVSIFSLGLPVETIKEEILDARLKEDLEQINTWGLMPVVCEIIPDIDGVLPETIQPNRAAYLEKIIDKIARTAILTEKAIH
ncbi:MAG: hypothetical protein J6N46_06375 [Bacteroidales bacterium]|nr:hypothetical protein [Bacteroidales bacterium]